MIGFWDYTVILTYMSLASAVSGIFCASSGYLRWAVFCLAVSGFCDMFDGKIARTKKNRTEDEKSFGIQIDSLCDIVCFAILPVIICYKIGMNHIYGMIILILYSLEEKRQGETDEARKYYQGLPITSMAIILPILFVTSPLFPSHQIFMIVLHIIVVLVALLFITNFKFRKPDTIEIFILVIVVAIAVAVIIFVERSFWRILHIYR